MVVPRGGKFEYIEGLPCELLNIDSKYLNTSATKIRKKLSEEALDMYLSDREWYNNIE